MSYIIVGLGNPGEEYEMSRHNTGRILVEKFAKKNGFSDWEVNSKDTKKKSYLVSKGKIGKHSVTLVLPELFMNKSGVTLKALVTSKKKAEKLVVIYDDIDLPFGSTKIAFSRGSGGHNGLESVIRAIKTKDFIRIRVGVAPTTPSGKLRKPKGEKKVLDFLLGDYRKKEMETIPKIAHTINKILETIIEEGRVSAMNTHN